MLHRIKLTVIVNAANKGDALSKLEQLIESAGPDGHVRKSAYVESVQAVDLHERERG